MAFDDIAYFGIEELDDEFFDEPNGKMKMYGLGLDIGDSETAQPS